MELRHLRYFLAIADAGSATRAAEQVLIAQPSLSRQLVRLERELGITLFHHGPGRLRLTRAGQQFLPVARDLVARAAAAHEAATALATGLVRRLSIAAPATTISDVIAPFIAQTTADEFLITVVEALPARAYAALQDTADVAVSSVPAPAHLAGRPVARLPVLAYVPPGHPWSALEGIDLATLATAPLLLLTQEHRTRRVFDHAVEQASLSCRTVLETSVPQIAQALAAAGHGVAVVSDDPRYGLHPLRIHCTGGDLRIGLHAGWDPSHYAAPVIASLVDRLAGFCVSQYGEPAPDLPGPPSSPAAAETHGRDAAREPDSDDALT